MNYVPVLILAVLSTIKVSFQSRFSKTTVKNTADILIFNFLVFLFSGLIFSYGLIGVDMAVLIYALAGAVFTVLFQLCYTEALSLGNVSLTVMIVNLGIVINVLFSYFVYHEPLSWLRIIGIVLTVITFIICVDFKNSRKAEAKWLFFAVSAMITTTAASGIQQIFSKSPYATHNRAYVSGVYLIGSVLILCVYLIFHKNGRGKTFLMSWNIVLLALASGVCLGLYKFVSTHALSVVDGTFFFPARAGGIILFSTISGVLIFKDKLSTKQKLSVVVGTVAVVLINF